MRQITLASITASKKAGIALRLLLAATLALSSLFIAAPAWADEAEREGEEAASLAPQSFDPLETLGGTCGADGTNLTWSLDSATGALTISGTGAMANWGAWNGRVPWYDYRDLISSVTLSDGVTSIGDIAFSDCTNLTSITIPAGVTSIGTNAFFECTNLTSIAIPSSVMISIGDNAFDSCTALTSITISAGVTSIGHNAFFNCVSLTSVAIPSGMASIGNYAFAYCVSLTSIAIPEGVTSIGGGAFSACRALTSVTIPSSVTTIRDFAFSNCTSLASIAIPEGVTSLGRGAFSGCWALTSVAIPSSVTTIGDSAFSDCTSLASIAIPSGVTSIGSDAFSDCPSLVSISVDSGNTAYSSDGYGVLFNKAKTELIQFPPTSPWSSYAIPSGVTTISSSAFYRCTALVSIAIPSSVTSIGGDAFRGCSSLSSIAIPSSVTSIGSDAFSDCASLTSISVDPGNTAYSSDDYGVLFNKMKTELIQFPPASPQTSYAIPSGVISIRGGAFQGCASLASVTIPSSVTSIGSDAFSDCVSLVSISVDPGNTAYSADDYGVLFNKTKTRLILFPPASPQTSYAIPESVTSIEFAFQGCASLVSITIPSRVTSIESRAFEGCTSLASVTIPSSVTSIGSDAFSNCVSLASISVDSGNTAYSSDDYGVLFNKMKTELIQFPPASPQTSYAIPEGVTLIRYSAFRSVLPHSADIPASVTAIGAGAFSGCASLISLSIPSSVTAIGDGAFAGCASLASVAIPTSVTSIGIYAFAGCAPLSSLAIPASVVTNSFGAFIGCEGPLYYEAQGAPDSWILWDFGYDGQVFWGQSPPEPDTVAPVLSEGFAARTSAASATVSFASSEAGSCYYAIVAAGSPAPVIDASGVGSPLAAGVQSLSLDGLGSAAAWDVYLVGKDAAGNVSVPLKIAIPDYVVSVAQHDGIDRFATAVKASQKAYPDPSKVDAVVLAYAYDFPDALAASYLAGALGAPILLTDSGALDAITEEEIRRLAPSVVYIVGGTGSVSDAVAGAVGAYPSVSSVTRLGGEGREETAYLIAREAAAQRGAPSTAFVVDAKNFPDALSAGSLAASQGAPILLTGTGTLDFWAQRFLEESAIGDIVVVGGPGSVPAQVEEQLRALSHAPAVTRWSGTDRYETSADALNKGIAKWGINPTVIGLASGDGFPDALVGGAAIGGRGGLLAITDPDELSVAATSLINTYKGAINGIEIFGGPGTIRVQGAVQTLLG